MNGPAHYRAAEKCMESVTDDSQMAIAALAEAQVHATLALVAATVETACCVGNGNGATVDPEWNVTWLGGSASRAAADDPWATEDDERDEQRHAVASDAAEFDGAPAVGYGPAPELERQ